MLRSFTSYHPGLLTDLYHPDAAYISWRTGRNGLTTFDLFARRAPYSGAFMLVAGIETALEFVRFFAGAVEVDSHRFLAVAQACSSGSGDSGCSSRCITPLA